MKKRQKGLVASATLCVLAITVMFLSLTIGHRKKQPEFTPPPFDVGAVAGTPSVPEGLGWQELDARAYLVGICGKFIPKGNAADVWLTNPESNAVWLKVRILDEKGNILGETGIVKPGEYVRSVTLDTVPKTGKPIVLKIMAYQPETYYSEGAVSLATKVG